MTKIGNIKKMLYTDFSDGQMHTVDEFRKMAHKKGIIEDNEDSALGNTLFSMKNSNEVEKVGKGIYIIHKKNFEETEETTVGLLIKRIKKIKRMSAVDVVKEGSVKLEKEIQEYRELKKELDDLFK